MLKKEVVSASGGGGCSRACDSCRAAACAVYCRADLAYLCAGCDARIHAANQLSSRHERVWVCEACERAPAAFTCKADAASLCTTCDADIHAANPLARRHHRVPILPIAGCLYGPSTNHHARPLGSVADTEDGFLAPEANEEGDEEEQEDETSSWLLLNPAKNNQQSNGFLFGGDDEYLDLEEYSSCNENQYQDQYNQQQQQQSNFNSQQNQMKNDVNDSVVPVQYGTMDQHHQQQLEMDYDGHGSKAGFSYTASLSHSVSMSSMDASIVPDSIISDVSHLRPRTPKGTIDLFSSPPLQVPAQFSPMDREARVLRYREKRKTRKFEKTIRYASRKAYAETRPRIKGRFAKRTDAEVEVDQMFVKSVMADTGYGIVPSY